MDLIEILDTLSKRLSESGVERTAGLRRTMGSDCFYYKKSLDLFERNDFDDLRGLISLAEKEFSKIE